MTYAPDTDFVGIDTFTYVASDGVGGTGTATVTVSVGGLVTNNDIFAVPFDDPGTTADDATIATLDVLANDEVIQAANGVATIQSVVSIGGVGENLSLGTMSVSGDDLSLEFDPGENQRGELTFRYTLIDGSSPPLTATGTVTVVVVEEGVAANGDVFTVEVDSSDNPLDVLLNDAAIPDVGQVLSIASFSAGSEGGSIASEGGVLLYTPAAGFRGEESFTYSMTDGRNSDSATVVVDVTDGVLSANPDAFTVFFVPPTFGQQR